ncbi:MAG: RNA polymerase sigma factor [Phycisphaeraceae bacterium]|nr:RNA polymerase sigma factor [Phycisphaeraceae bacterium]
MGEQEQFLELYQRHGHAVWRYLCARHRSQDAQDLWQETFLHAWRGRNALLRAASAKAWLLTIARNRSVSAIRRRRVTQTLGADVPAQAAATDDPRLADMQRWISELSPIHRQVLELRLHEELSYEQIAGVLDLPVGTVRSRLHHAVRTLRQKAAEANKEP